MKASNTVAIKTIPDQATDSPKAPPAHPGPRVGDGSRSVRTSALLRWGRGVCLPPPVEQLLVDVVADGFVVYCCGPRDAPRALVASYPWDDYVDLVTIRRFDRIITARVPAPRHAPIDVFDPQIVVWAYEGPPQPALRALLRLLPPHHPQAPTSGYPAPPGLHIPRAQQRPLTIRFPPPHWAATRAERLAAMTADGDDGWQHADHAAGRRCLPPHTDRP